MSENFGEGSLALGLIAFCCLTEVEFINLLAGPNGPSVCSGFCLWKQVGEGRLGISPFEWVVDETNGRAQVAVCSFYASLEMRYEHCVKRRISKQPNSGRPAREN